MQNIKHCTQQQDEQAKCIWTFNDNINPHISHQTFQRDLSIWINLTRENVLILLSRFCDRVASNSTGSDASQKPSPDQIEYKK